MAAFIAVCPHCGQKANASEEWIGQQTQCPNCKQIFGIQRNKKQTACATTAKVPLANDISISGYRSRKFEIVAWALFFLLIYCGNALLLCHICESLFIQFRANCTTLYYF